MRSVAASISISMALLMVAATLPAAAEPESLTQKINAYVGCINRLSERAYDSRSRYFSWVGKNGPTGKERIIYGLYTIYDTADCRDNVERVNALEPREPDLEAAATAYVSAVGALEPLLKDADDYYSQQDYRDDKMARGKALHPRLVSAWSTFAAADQRLRAGLDVLSDRRATAKLADIEANEGRNARYHVEALMVQAKRIIRAQSVDPPNVTALVAAVGDYESLVKATEAFVGADKNVKVESGFVSAAKTFLTTAKQLMRRVRDKVPYSSGDKMLLDTGAGAWMVEGSPARLTRDYNQLVEAYNRSNRS